MKTYMLSPKRIRDIRVLRSCDVFLMNIFLAGMHNFVMKYYYFDLQRVIYMLKFMRLHKQQVSLST